jgi:hypothetical protein
MNNIAKRRVLRRAAVASVDCAAIEAIGTTPGHAVDEKATRRVGVEVRQVVFAGTYLIHYRVKNSAGTVDVCQVSARGASAEEWRAVTPSEEASEAAHSRSARTSPWLGVAMH